MRNLNLFFKKILSNNVTGRLAFVFFVVITIQGSSLSQSTEDSIVVVEDSLTTEKVKKGSIFSGRPGKALLLSLAIPGAGQIYNKSYLRVPFVWGAVGGMGYLLRESSRQYTCFRDAYIQRVDGATNITLPEHCTPVPLTNPGIIIDTESAELLRLYRDQANTTRQYAILGFTLVWLANGVDAFVDAHLKDFDIDEDLSIDIGPKTDNDPYAPMRLGIFVQF